MDKWRLWLAIRPSQSGAIIDLPSLEVVRRRESGGWVVAIGWGAYPLQSDLRTFLSSCQAALVMASGGTEFLVAHLFVEGYPELHVASGPLFDSTWSPDPREFALLTDWATTSAELPADIPLMHDLWYGRGKGDERAASFLIAMGLELPSETPCVDQLIGCSGPLFFDQPQWVADRSVDWERDVPWILGRGDEFVGIWDLRHPDLPPARWPDTPQGREDAIAEIRRRVIDPIIDRTVLEGDRGWIRSQINGEHACLVYLNADYRLAIIADTDPPRTFYLSTPGSARIRDDALRRTGIHVDASAVRGSRIDWTLSTWDRAKAAAQAYLGERSRGVVQEVPSYVDRRLRATLAWIRGASEASNP